MRATYEAMVTDAGPLVDLNGAGGRREVPWGRHWQIGSAAYWIDRAEEFAEDHSVEDHPYRLGRNLVEEVAACVLGGYGMPFEIGLAAFHSVRVEVLERNPTPSAESLEAVLRQPLVLSGTVRNYRFPRQRSVRLAQALEYVHGSDHEELDDRALRDWLLGAPGIGLKTASWIVRNLRVAGEVAVLDVHVLRAGTRAHVFPPEFSVSRDYRRLEDWFLDWARVGGVSAAALDAVIWSEQASDFRTTRRSKAIRSGA